MTDLTPPLCDMDPTHGPMQADPIHKLNGEIDTRFGLYWFCQVPGCDGYGGEVEKAPRKAPPPAETLQLQLI